MALNRDSLPQLLDASRRWQMTVSMAENPEHSDSIGTRANIELARHIGARRSQRVIVGAVAALMLPDGLSREEVFWPAMQFGGMTVSGNLARPIYVRPDDMAGIIAWPIFDAQVHTAEEVDITPDSDPEIGAGYYLPVEGEVRRPLYFPVTLIEYAIAAA